MPREPRRAERPDSNDGLELLDAGDGRRLERFGARVVDRPAPGATGPRLADFLTWRRADLRFDTRGARDGHGGWFGEPEALESWAVRLEGLLLELRPTASGGLGIYPEHAANLAWVADRVAERLARPPGEGGQAEPPQVLHLFAHTGLLTLGAARAGAAVTHVDASRTAVAWARRNAELSDHADAPVRWLVDDATAFVAREGRRGRRYDGIVLDPPSFGRAGRRQWRLADELPDLLAACRQVATDDAFMLLTAHTTGLDGEELRRALEGSFGRSSSTQVERLALDAASGARLDLGWSVRRTG